MTAIASPPPSAPNPALNPWREYFAHLVRKAGPDPSDYGAFDIWLETLAEAVRLGTASPAEVHDLLAQGGQAFSTTQTMQGFVRSKPHGYPGDFELIDRIHREWISSDPLLLKWDLYFHFQAAPRALRGTRQYFSAWLGQAEAGHFPAQPSLHLLHLGGGPGRELLEYFQNHPEGRLVATLMDPDPRALAYAARVCEAVASRVAFHGANPLGFRPAGVPHFIWANGLLDCLDDRNAVNVVRQLWRLLEAGGEIAASNFSPKNPTGAYMELLGWTVNCRDAGQLAALAHQAGVPDEAIRIGREPEGAILFLHLQK